MQKSQKRGFHTACRMENEDYPKTALEFVDLFLTEKACWDYLIKIRWPGGFICPKCKGSSVWVNMRDVFECASCSYQTSITAGTVLEGTHKSLREWFHAMWWICTQTTSGSAKGLQRLLGLKSYQTAWAWLHKLRTAMVRSERTSLSGTVEVDETFIGGYLPGKRGRGAEGKTLVVVAVELDGKQNERIRLAVIPNASSEILDGFVKANIAKGSIVITDGWNGCNNLKKSGYTHKVELKTIGDNLLPHVHTIASLLKRWLLGTHHGAVSSKHLQSYLDEFVFRQNRRKSRYVGKIFYRLVQGAMVSAPKQYKSLVKST